MILTIRDYETYLSWQYAIHSHPPLHAATLTPSQIEDAIVPLTPREGEDHLRTSDVLAKLDELGDTVAVVWIGCVQYYTGQFFEVEPIARKTHEIVSPRKGRGREWNEWEADYEGIWAVVGWSAGSRLGACDWECTGQAE